MTKPDGEDRYCQNPDVLGVDMDGDLIMMSIERGDYYGISGIGPSVWKELETPKTLAELVNSVCDEYEVDADTARADLQRFLKELSENGMVTTS